MWHENAIRENAGHEIAGHKNAGLKMLYRTCTKLDGMKLLLTCSEVKLPGAASSQRCNSVDGFICWGLMFFYSVVCVCQVIMKITVIVIRTKMLIRKRRARHSSCISQEIKIKYKK